MTEPNAQALYAGESKDWIAVVGFAPSKKHFPWGDERWSVWGVNDLCFYVPRVDVAFELHHTMNMGVRRSPEWEQALRSGGKRGAQHEIGKPLTPVFMQEAHPEYPSVLAFPKQRIISEFGRLHLPPLEYTGTVAPGADYFTNSISWMIALAILELTEEKTVSGRTQRVAKPGARLGIVGVSMAAESEYSVQKPSVEYWIGRAQGMGIDVWVPDDAHILHTATLYGYASSNALRVRLQSDKDDLRNKTIEFQQQEQQAQMALQQAQGSLIAVRAVKDYINGLERNLVIGTEIGIGEEGQAPTETDPNKLGSGRNHIITLENGQVMETVIVPSDNQQSVSVGGQ